MCRVIAIGNHKGGVGKTTTSINLAAALVRLGKKVLIVDMDPQGQAGLGLGVNRFSASIKDMLENIIMERDFDPTLAIVHHKEGIDIIPSNLLLTGVEANLYAVCERDLILKKYLSLIKDSYDFVLIDTGRSFGSLTMNALAAADSVIITLQPQFFSADSLAGFLNIIRGLKRSANPSIKIEGVLFAMDNPRLNNSKEIKKKIKELYTDIPLFENSIPRTEAISRASNFGVSIFEYEPKSQGAVKYDLLAKEVLSHG